MMNDNPVSRLEEILRKLQGEFEGMTLDVRGLNRALQWSSEYLGSVWGDLSEEEREWLMTHEIRIKEE